MRRSGVPVVDRLIGGMGPGLPLVIGGPPGSGRTVLALQITAAALAAQDIVALLSAEPAPLLLRQAATLGIDLEPAVTAGQLLMLELDPGAPASLAASGGKALVAAVLAEHPSVSVAVIDPFTALTAELLDEAPLRAVCRDLIAGTPRTTLVLTVETAPSGSDAPVERALAEVCGSYLTLGRRRDGRRTLSVEKTRAGAGAAEAVEFLIGPSGAELVRETSAETPTRRETHTAAPAAPAPLRAQALPAAAEAPAEERRGPATILVVDHDPERRARWSAWLEESYGVVSAGDGFEAVAALLGETPDLILLDLVLPRVSGYEVLAALHRAAQSIPILCATESTGRASERFGPLVLGAADVLTSPVARFELLHKIELLLRLGGPPPPLLDHADAQALFGATSESRVLTASDFRERIDRACEFGSRFSVTSTLVALAAPSAEVLDRLVGAADSALRFEDALLLVSKRRALLLLVAAEPDHVPAVMERLERRLAEAGGAAPALRWHAHDAREGRGRSDWRPLFESPGEGDA